MSVTISGSGQIVKQVIQIVKTDAWSTTSTSWVDVTGLSASITPTSASNKILVMVSLSIAGNGEHGGAKLVRNSTDLGVGDASGSATRATMYGLRMYNVGTNAAGPTCGYTYLDNPGTTSSTTYKIQAINPSGAVTTVNQSANQGNSDGNYWRTSSTITLMEIAYA